MGILLASNLILDVVQEVFDWSKSNIFSHNSCFTVNIWKSTTKWNQIYSKLLFRKNELLKIIKLLMGNFSMFLYTILIICLQLKTIYWVRRKSIVLKKHFIDESTNAHVKQIVIVELALTIHLSWTFLTILINKTHTIQFYWT